MTRPEPGRRARQRAATVADVLRAAREHLVEGGPQAVSLRAIARSVGLSAAGMYRYYPSLEAIVVELITDLYQELGTAVEQARDAAGPDPVDQLRAMSRAFRRWSVAHPQEFRLVFTTPVPAPPVEPPDALQRAGARFALAFIEAVALLWRDGLVQAAPPRTVTHPDARFAARLVPPFTLLTADLPIDVRHLVLVAWTRLYGLVAMEVFGQLSWALSDAEPLFDLELDAMTRSFGR